MRAKEIQVLRDVQDTHRERKEAERNSASQEALFCRSGSHCPEALQASGLPRVDEALWVTGLRFPLNGNNR